MGLFNVSLPSFEDFVSAYESTKLRPIDGMYYSGEPVDCACPLMTLAISRGAVVGKLAFRGSENLYVELVQFLKISNEFANGVIDGFDNTFDTTEETLSIRMVEWYPRVPNPDGNPDEVACYLAEAAKQFREGLIIGAKLAEQLGMHQQRAVVVDESDNAEGDVE